MNEGAPWAPIWHQVDGGDVVCQHGTAIDVHCCNCHHGFLFSPTFECVCEFDDGPDNEREEKAA